VPAARLRFALVLAAAVALAGCAAPGSGPRARADLIVLADTVVTRPSGRATMSSPRGARRARWTRRARC